MARDFSYEEKITDGKVAIFRKFIVDFDKITITFENITTKLKKELSFSRVIKLSMQADSPNDYDDDMDRMAYRTLIGFDYEKMNNFYEYVIKTDDYKIIIESLNFVSITVIE